MIRRPPRSTRTDTLLSLHDALPISLLLKGAIEVGIAGQTHASESGPSVNLFVSRHEWQLHHRFSSLSSLQYLTLHLDAEAADELLRSEEHTSELQSLMRISYAVFCLKKKTKNRKNTYKQ